MDTVYCLGIGQLSIPQGNKYRPKRQCSAAGKVTGGLAGVALAMRHRHCGISIYGLNGLKKADEHPAFTPLKTMAPAPFTFLKFCRGHDGIVHDGSAHCVVWICFRWTWTNDSQRTLLSVSIHGLANTTESFTCGGDADFLSNYSDHLLYYSNSDHWSTSNVDWPLLSAGSAGQQSAVVSRSVASRPPRFWLRPANLNSQSKNMKLTGANITGRRLQIPRPIRVLRNCKTAWPEKLSETCKRWILHHVVSM